MIPMRPLESDLELPDGCSCCYCRPLAVSDLDRPVIGSVGLFSRNSRSTSKFDLVLVDSIDSTFCLPLLGLQLLAVANQV